MFGRARAIGAYRGGHKMINDAYFPALAAFTGSSAGILATVVSNWLALRRKYRVGRGERAHAHRQKLYKRFIVEVSKLYADALVSNKSEISNLVTVYALIARMRVVSSDEVIERAENAARLIIQTYLAPNREFIELPNLINEMDPLRHFSEASRRELQGN